MARAGTQVAAAGRMLAAFPPGLGRRVVKAAKETAGLTALWLSILAIGASVSAGGVMMVMREPSSSALAPDPVAPSQAPLPASTWLAIPKPIALYALESIDIPAGARGYAARRRSDGETREDLLFLGAFSEDALFMALRFRGSAAEAETPASLFVDVVRGAADQGLAVLRMASPAEMTTKFGAAESADLMLAGAGAERPCIAFRVAIADPGLQLAGVACGPSGRAIDRAQLSCLIDRVALLGSGDDAIRKAFAHAELRRRPICDGPRITATGRRAGWLDPAGQTPPLKPESPQRR